jgi:uncharacterized membrane protein
MDDKEKYLDELLLEEDGQADAMRAEAATRAHASNNWTMAALITVNGGAIITLVGHEERSWAVGIALLLYVLGIVSALIAGRLSASLAYEAEAMFVSTRSLSRAGRRRWRLFRAGSPQATAGRAAEMYAEAEKDLEKAKQDFDKAPTPDMALGLGILFFFCGCLAAGVSLF